MVKGKRGEQGRFVTLKSGRVIFIPEGKRTKWANVRGRIKTKQGDTQSQLGGLRSRLASAAQRVVDEWDPEWYGGGGVCDDVNREMQDVISSSLGMEVADGGQEGSDHAYTIAYRIDDRGKVVEAYGVDIPPGVYETGGGYSWEKIEGVEVSPEDVVISRIPDSDIPYLGLGQ